MELLLVEFGSELFLDVCAQREQLGVAVDTLDACSDLFLYCSAEMIRLAPDDFIGMADLGCAHYARTA